VISLMYVQEKLKCHVVKLSIMSVPVIMYISLSTRALARIKVLDVLCLTIQYI
jgi:hypothetical protein